MGAAHSASFKSGISGYCLAELFKITCIGRCRLQELRAVVALISVLIREGPMIAGPPDSLGFALYEYQRLTPRLKKIF